MTMLFYPHEDDLDSSTLLEKTEVLLEAAGRYHAIVIDAAEKKVAEGAVTQKKQIIPRDLTAVFNWEEIAKLLREMKDLPESTQIHKLSKADHLMKLAEIYEVLRAAKMPKLEAVRLALVNEANQLKASAAQGV